MIDYKDYESRIKKLVDTHISADEVIQITRQVNIFDKDAFREEVERATGSVASKADMIAHQLKRTLIERMDEDPALYKKFSQMLQEAIDEFRLKRLTEIDYLKKVNNIYDNVIDNKFEGIPESLSNKPEARAYFNAIIERIEKKSNEIAEPLRDRMARAGMDIERIIENQKIVDWKRNLDVEKQMRNEIEDYLITLSEESGIELTFDDIDLILDNSIKIAKSRD